MAIRISYLLNDDEQYDLTDAITQAITKLQKLNKIMIFTTQCDNFRPWDVLCLKTLFQLFYL